MTSATIDALKKTGRRVSVQHIDRGMGKRVTYTSVREAMRLRRMETMSPLVRGYTNATVWIQIGSVWVSTGAGGGTYEGEGDEEIEYD